jgi:hypothetical protein
MNILKRMVSQRQHLNSQNVTLLHASKGKVIIAAERDQVHTQQITKNC